MATACQSIFGRGLSATRPLQPRPHDIPGHGRRLPLLEVAAQRRLRGSQRQHLVQSAQLPRDEGEGGGGEAAGVGPPGCIGRRLRRGVHLGLYGGPQAPRRELRLERGEHLRIQGSLDNFFLVEVFYIEYLYTYSLGEVFLAWLNETVVPCRLHELVSRGERILGLGKVY